MLTLPGLSNAPTFDGQAARDEQDWNALIALSEGNGVLTGCGITPQVSPDMTVKGAAGIVIINGALVTVAADPSITIGAASTTDRKDIITVNSSGAFVVTAGTPCGTAGYSRTSSGLAPASPAIPANSDYVAQVYVEGTGATPTTSIVAGNIIDKTPMIGGGAWAQLNPESAAYAYVTPVNPDRVLIDPTGTLTDDAVSILQTFGVAETNPVQFNWDSGDYIKLSSDYNNTAGQDIPTLTPYSSGLGANAMAQVGGLFLVQGIAGPYLYFVSADGSEVAFFTFDPSTGDLTYVDPTTSTTFAILNSGSGNIVQVNDPTPDGFSALQVAGQVNINPDGNGNSVLVVTGDEGVGSTNYPALWRGGYKAPLITNSPATFPPGSVGVDLTPLQPEIAVCASDASVSYIKSFGLGGVFGDGSSGSYTLDGTSPAYGMTPASSVYTMTADIWANTMTINSGVTLNANGYKIFAWDIVGPTSGLAYITSTGGNASGSTGGIGADQGSIGGGTQGGNGSTTTGGNGLNCTPANGLTGFGGTGTTGGSSGTTVHSGGSGGTVAGTSATNIKYNPIREAAYMAAGTDLYNSLLQSSLVLIGGGSGGGAGGGDGTYAGGGGGGGGGVIDIFAGTITGNILFQALGGNGAAGTGGNAGGGAGGGGGLIVIATSTATVASNISSNCSVRGGTGGALSGSGHVGPSGNSGLIIVIPA